MTDDLSTRLLEAIEAAERVARTCEPGAGSTWSSHGGQVLDEDGAVLVNTARATEVYVRHMARWDPAAVLRLCQAHREIVRQFQRAWDRRDSGNEQERLVRQARAIALIDVLDVISSAYGLQREQQ